MSGTGLTDVPVDRDVALWFARLVARQPWLADVGAVGAVVLHPWTFRLAVAAACIATWRAGRRRVAAVVAVTMAAGGLLGVLVKLVVQRPRPVWSDPVAQEVGYAFPSGHALNAALGVGLLLLLARPHLAGLGWATAVSAGALVVAVTMLDRLLLGVHYLSDVGVGALGGIVGTAAAARAVSRRRL